ncbi:MAG: hypothetical protein GYA39_01920 [Methanothrix sp.]|nr:hypothetical protein [Methanothrix sp.]
MKWLKGIFHGKKDSGNAETLALSEIYSWLKVHSEPSGFEDRLQDIYLSIEEAARALAGDLRALGSAEPNSTTPPKLLRAGLAARGEVVKQMEALVERMDPPRGRDIESASDHHWAMVKGLERTITTFGRAQRYAAALFPKEIESINVELSRISRLLVELEDVIGQWRAELEEIWYARELADSINKDLSLIADLKERAKAEEENLSGLLASMARMEEEQKRLAEGPEGKRIEELKKDIEQKREHLRQAEAEMANLISPLNKALGRIRKQGSSDRLILQHAKVFEMLLTAPSKVADKDIAGSLQELRSHLASLGLKDRKKEKTLDHIDLLITNRSLEKARSRQAALEKAIEEQDKLLSECSRDLLQLKEQLSRTKKSLQRTKASVDESHQSLRSIQEKADQDTSELNGRLTRLSGKTVKVDLSR